VALRIEALADELVLRTRQQPSTRAGLPLQAEARVTALGLPVPDAQVEFRLAGERSSKQIRPTNDAGVAKVDFAADAGGQLSAELLNSALDLGDEAAIVLEEAAKISLSQPLHQLTMEAGAETTLDLAIRVDETGSYQIELDQQATPSGGLQLTTQSPGGGLGGDGPGTFVVRQVFKAVKPGIYDVVTKATLSEASAETVLRVIVGPGEAKNRLVIYQPSSDPAILRPQAGSQRVVFKVAVAGTSTPPESLILQRLPGTIATTRRASVAPGRPAEFAESSRGFGVFQLLRENLLGPLADVVPVQLTAPDPDFCLQTPRPPECLDVTASLTADPGRINEGQASTLRWQSTNAILCQSEGFNTLDEETSGNVDVSPTTTTTYTITCSNYNDSASASATVTVVPPPPPAPTATLTANPDTIESGGSSTLAWDSTGADSCQGDGFSTDGATSGDVNVSPTATTAYTVTCSNSSDSASASATVTVNEPPPPPPPLPPIAANPCIEPEPVSEIVGDPSPPESVVVLRDDGQGPDEVAGDLVYTAVADADAAVETTLLYRVVAEYPCGIVASKALALPVADLPTELFPTSTEDFPLVEDPVTGERFASNQVFVRFRPDVTPAEIRRIVEREDAEIIGFEPTLNLAQVESEHADGVIGVRRAMASFSVYEEVSYADPNHEIVLDGFPDDPEFPDQKSLDIVRALEAWLAAGARPDEGEARAIAILDEGVDYDHKDLKQRVLRSNDGEVEGKNCVDRGKEPKDKDGHGTRVAGVAAARTGNGRDVAGAAFDAKFVPVKIREGSRGYVYEDGAICGLKFAREHLDVARIANLSNGVNYSDPELRDAVRATLAAGIVIVASAGNNPPFKRKHYPAAYNEILQGTEETSDNGLIAVANTDDKDEPYDDKDDGTVRGPWVDLGAPGVDIVTTGLNNDTVRPTPGTSYSAPLVAGAAALLWSRDPTATVQGIEQSLKGAAQRAKEANEIGDGRLDFAEAVLNGSAELHIRDAGSPGDWPSAENSTCSYERPRAGGDESTFFEAQHGRQFLLCEGFGQAATLKAFRVPEGIKRLTFAVRLAAVASPEVGEARLEAVWQTQDGVLEPAEADDYTLTLAECKSPFKLPGAPPEVSCSGWQNWNKVIVKNPRPGNSAFIFRARLADSNGPVWLMLDDFRIKEVE
jgi:hypothetical protein